LRSEVQISGSTAKRAPSSASRGPATSPAHQLHGFGCASGYSFPDPDLTGSIDELRIYAGVLTTNDVANSFLAGPDTLFAIGSNPKIKISIALSGSQPILSWPMGILEQANEITGPWTTVSNAVSPYAPSTSSQSKHFYRVRLN